MPPGDATPQAAAAPAADGPAAAEPAGARKTRQLGLVTYKRRPGPEQVTLSVQINVPGSWFARGAAGGLSAAERAEKYRATAVEYNERHVFEPGTRSRSAKVGEAIRFLCQSDAEEDASHSGFWMRLDDWNRYRHDTYKDDPDGEEPFIPRSEIVIAHKALPQPTENVRPLVYSYFDFIKTGVHIQNEGRPNEKKVSAEWWTCKNKVCVRAVPPIAHRQRAHCQRASA